MRRWGTPASASWGLVITARENLLWACLLDGKPSIPTAGVLAGAGSQTVAVPKPDPARGPAKPPTVFAVTSSTCTYRDSGAPPVAWVCGCLLRAGCAVCRLQQLGDLFFLEAALLYTRPSSFEHRTAADVLTLYWSSFPGGGQDLINSRFLIYITHRAGPTNIVLSRLTRQATIQKEVANSRTGWPV